MSHLRVEAVTKEFPTHRDPLVVLRGVSLQLADSENMAILGPSGSGKTTLLSILGTLDEPTSGDVLLNGSSLFRLKDAELASLRNRQIGFVFQDHHLLPQCTVLENILLPTIAHGSASTADIDRAKMLIERIGLTNRQTHRPTELSGGERQRTALARALIRKPVLLLADEPTGNLDRTTARSVSQLLLEVSAQERMMLIVATHNLKLADLLQRRVELDAGKLQEVTS